ncbi:MAG: protein-export chaperone SecB [Desulfatibacillaceae bacterium]|nr:protein-export chaperone SecB [Desulfatibacillaceae bacterium]
MPKISLNSVVLQKSFFEADLQALGKMPDGAGEVACNFDIELAHQTDKAGKHLNVLLGAKSRTEKGEPSLLFEYHIVFAGSFALDEPMAKNDLERLASINCPAILWPFVRQHLADLTAKAGFSPLLLPVINFVTLSQAAGSLKPANPPGTKTKKRKNPPLQGNK